MKKFLCLSTFSILLLVSVCKAFSPAKPTVTTDPATDVRQTTATLGGNVTATGGATVTDRGIVWNTTSAPTVVADNVIKGGVGTGVFSKVFAGVFPPNTTIHVRAYATNTQGTAYGSEVTFTTVALIGTGAIYDFEPASGTTTGFNSKIVTSTNTESSTSIKITSVSDNIYRSSDWGSVDGFGRIGTEGLYLGLESLEASFTVTMQNNIAFDLLSFYIANENGALTDFTITSSKGSIVIPIVQGLTATFLNIADNANAAYFKGIRSFTVVPTGGAFMEVDHFVMENVTASPLPLKLLSFTGHKQQSNALLTWNTADENAFSYFEVERSTDARDFNKIATVMASNSKKYTYEDPTPGNTVVSYRLKMIDKDGSFNYSAVVTLRSGNSIHLAIYPNPASSTLQVSLPKLTPGKGMLKVLNSTGQLVLSTAYQNEGAPMVIPLSIASLGAGSYYLQVIQDRFKESTHFVKQ